MSHGNSGGITKWKKCEVPWANPTSEMTVASRRKAMDEEAAEALDKGQFDARTQPIYFALNWRPPLGAPMSDSLSPTAGPALLAEVRDALARPFADEMAQRVPRPSRGFR